MSCIIPSNLVDRSTKKAAQKADLQEETKEILLQLDDSIILSAAIKGPSTFIESNKNPPTDDYVRTDMVDLGWKMRSQSLGWKKTANAEQETATSPNNEELDTTQKEYDAKWESNARFVKKMHKQISPLFSTTILNPDDLFTNYTLREKFEGYIANRRWLFPLDDSDVMPPEEETFNRFLTDLKLTQGQALTETYNTDFNMITDESFSRIFFNGMGCVLLTKQEEVSDSEFGPFVVDMPLHKLKVRDLYREYGARIHFSADQLVTAIYDYKKEKLYKPRDDGWTNSKLLANITAVTLITMREHLSWTHLIVSNDVTRESTLKLPPNHPIRRLLTVFTFHTTEVNLKAFNALVPKNSLLYRSNGLTYESTLDVFDMSFKECNVYEPFSERKYNSEIQRLVDEGKFPYVTEGVEFYEIVRAFVREWVDKSGPAASDSQAIEFYSAMRKASKGQKYELPEFSVDNLINLCSTIIFTVTCYHELVGHVVDYVLPYRSGFRLTKKDPSQLDLQAFIGAAIIGASTSVRMPALMSSFPNFFGQGGAPLWEVNVWAKFQESLKAQSAKVKAADAEREVEFKYFDPARFECSVSV